MTHRERRKGKPRGSLVIDLVLRPIGRLKRASGTDDPHVLKKYKKTLYALSGDSTLWPYLKALRDDKHLSVATIHAHFIGGTLAELPIGEGAKPLVATYRAWATTYDCSDDHRSALEDTASKLEKTAPEAKVADIAKVLERLRETLGKEHPRSFNIRKANCQAFIRSTLKRSHPLWTALQAVELAKVKKQRIGRPLTPDEMRSLFPNPESDPVDAMAWTMATTGMHQKEYWGTWERQLDRIHISGTKREGRDRDVPLVRVPVSPSMHRGTFEEKVRIRSRGNNLTMTVYDFRRTYANWMEAAQILRIRRKMYLGHTAGDITELYERHEITEALRSDAEKLKTFLLPPPTPMINREAK